MRRAGLLAAALAVAGLAGCEGGPVGESAETPRKTLEPATARAADTPAAAQPPAKPRRIPIQVVYDEPTELSLAGGECHVLELDLEADRHVELAIDQHGMDLYTTLEPPGTGERIFFDSPTGPSGFDRAAFVSAAAGLHRFEICPFPSNAPRTPYDLRLTEPRAAAAADRALARAFRRYSEGERLDQDGDPGAAAGAFAEALRGFEEARALRPQGWAHGRLGTLAKGRGELELAASHLARWVAAHRELGDRGEEAFALSYLGTVLSDLSRLEEARDVHRRSVELAERAGDRRHLAKFLRNLALVHQDLGETLEAVEVHRRRRALAAEMGDAASGWHALSRIGKVYRQSGDDARAERIFEEALAFARSHGLERGVVESLVDLGRVHVDREEPREALVRFQEALARTGSTGPDLTRAGILNNIGRCYRRLDQRRKALDSFDRALSALPAGGWEARLLEAMVLVNVASLHILEGDFEAAEEPSERALSIYRGVGRPIHTTSALKCLAEVRAAQGELEEAVSHLAELVEIVEARRSRSAMEELRATLIEDNYFRYEFYVEVLLRLHERHPERGFAARAFEVAERAKARVLLDNLARTEGEIRGTADPAAVARREALERQMSALESRLVRIRFREGTPEPVRALQDRLNDLEAEHAVATARIFAGFPGWSALLESEPLSLEEIQAEVLGDGETLLVTFLLGDTESSVWIVGRDSLHVAPLPGRERIERLAREAAARLRDSDQPHLRLQADLAVESLSREVLGPIATYLDGRKLIFVKDGALHYVPFGALHLPGSDWEGNGRPVPLVERFELVEVPSASAAVSLRRRRSGRPPSSRELAILADPVFQSDDQRLREPASVLAASSLTGRRGGGNLERVTRGLGLGGLQRLTGSLEEARRIAALVPPERRLVALGFDAGRELLLDRRLARYRILHLAGHGLAHPDLTGLVLSLYDAEGRPVDGLIRPYELYGIELSAELVVLSACRTGLGTEVRGEGLLGLSRGFLYAGAAQVLASLWDVDDRATAELMERFYVALLRDGDPPAAALRKAQRSLRREPHWGAPHYWAGFVLQGDGG